MTDERSYDVIVIGGGSTGTNVAWYARDNGLTVALVERELVGGECSYWACVPSKALLGPAALLAAARHMPGVSTAVTGELDVAAVFARRDTWTSHLDDAGQVDWMDGIGAELVRGRGRITGIRRVEVERDDADPVVLTARRAVVVATGSRASQPPIDGLDRVRTWDNRDVTQADHVPDRLIVLGGGAVGCEMAQAYRRFGAEVTIVQRGGRLLSGLAPEVGAIVGDAFEKEGIRVLTGTSATAVSRPDGDDGEVVVTTDSGEQVVGGELLVAVGRTPNTDDIGLPSLDLEPGGWLETDDRLAVRGVEGDWLFAAGDVNGRALLTHQGKYQARIVGDVIAGRDVRAWADHVAVPRVVFTDPQVASVGLTEAEARDAGQEVTTVEADPTGVTGGALRGGGEGFAQLVIDADRRVVLGATFVGPGVGELLHAATIAIVGQVPIDVLWNATPAFPTVSEVWLRLLEADRDLP